ncbi:efflux RND transporter periplasmic adaptor subunit [Treponema primitia]|uniref:efflux RND transporter periplasmic adaptor subunit n=1 Tax=Treponema primitia TaxID=88058 RepID=UPI003980E895
MKIINFLSYPIVAVLILSAGACSPKSGGTSTYEYTTISRGTLEKTVSSTGSLKPVSTVNVLARMSGKVEKIHVDYNDIIHKGDILAELNTDMLRLQREQQAASVIKARANYELQQINYQNQQKLAEKNLISEYELRTGKTTLDIQAAELSASESSLRVIETEINQYALITSPIDGIVLERNISEGQTVVEGSSSNSTSLFTLAENLEEMQIEAGVGELDIPAIHKGQGVRFTLESLPGRNFSGIVEAMHLMPTIQDNVVSYTVIINVDNSEGSLLPGMTCSVEFIEERKENTLLIPNAALRYRPSGMNADEIADRVFQAGLGGMDAAQQAAALEAREKMRAAGAAAQAAAQRPAQNSGLSGMVMPQGPGMRQNRNTAAAANPAGGQRGSSGFPGRETMSPPKPLWFIDETGKPDCILVQTGISNGSFTEIRSGNNDIEGRQIILRERVQP